MMSTEKIVKNKGPKYSEMLIQLVEIFDDQLPEELTFEDTLEAGIDAWNLANNKEFLVSRDLYEQELKDHKNCKVIEKMVDYKLEKYPSFNNVIVDYSTVDNILRVKTQTQETRFNNLFKTLVNPKTK